MAATQPTSNPVPARKSFAQVAAAANLPPKPKDKAAKPHSPTTNSQQAALASVPPGNVNESNKSTKPQSPATTAAASQPVSIQQPPKTTADVDQLGRLMDKASVVNDVAPHPSVEELSKTAPPSDTKSVTSRTTLALDEKESLRPDDSASMQAAVEDGSLSPSGSAVANSKQSSDPDARAFRDQLHEIDMTGAQTLASERDHAAPKLPTPAPHDGAIVYSSSTPQTTYAPPQPPQASRPNLPLNALNNPPDDKLLDALASPKDRLFVLKVEQDMIDFIKDSKEECLQLPATNSFYRLLSHKLADYYLLGHLVDESLMSVRIFRTPNCRLPPPLIGSDPAVEGSEPPPVAPTRKIMRRNPTDNRSNEQGASSSDKNFDSLTSSKAPSDSGAGTGPDEAKDASADKLTMTREERETRYNEARARIFKDFEATEAAENSNALAEKGISRTSSASGVRKVKKKSKPKDDDGFEARSAFDQYGQRIAPSDSMDPAQFDRNVYGAPFASFTPGQFHPGMANFQSAQAYNYGNGYNQMPMPYWNGHQVPHGYPSPQHESPGYPPYGRPLNGYDNSQYAPVNMASQSTPKGNHPSLASYQQTYMPTNESFGWNQPGFMNAYGGVGGGYGYHDPNAQYPSQFYPGPMMQSPQMATAGPYQGFSGQENQHPGQNQPYHGYNNPHFNPRSQNFVPNSRGPYGQFSPDSNMGGYARNGQGPFFGSPQMQRQNSNTSHGSNFSSNHHYPQANNAGVRPNGRGQTHSPLRYPQGLQGRGQQPNNGNSNSITKWSTPANLPAKPPPPAVVSPFVDVPRDPDNQQPLPPKPFTNVTNNNNNPLNSPNQGRSR